MQTPAGKECRHYYEDFHRGRNIQECRLEKANPESEKWHPKDCERCPVPDILQANSSPDMELKLTIKSGMFGLRRRYEVEARCLKHHKPIDDPYVGCQLPGHHPGLDLFRQALNNDDDET